MTPTNRPSSPVEHRQGKPGESISPAGRDELLADLNELLEAERAGAKVALASIKASTDDYAALMRQVRNGEAHWCAMLDQQITRLGGTPSSATGAFHAKALAIADPMERLAFLNRGQAWVIRKLDAMLSKVDDDVLHADLQAMADAHRANIELVEGYQRQIGL